jgi:hypothetical protein
MFKDFLKYGLLIATTQDKITWSGIIIRNVKPHHTGDHYHLGSIRQIGSGFSVCNIILTQLDEIWKTTSIFLKMEDDLSFFK